MKNLIHHALYVVIILSGTVSAIAGFVLGEWVSVIALDLDIVSEVEPTKVVFVLLISLALSSFGAIFAKGKLNALSISVLFPVPGFISGSISKAWSLSIDGVSIIITALVFLLFFMVYKVLIKENKASI